MKNAGLKERLESLFSGGPRLSALMLLFGVVGGGAYLVNRWRSSHAAAVFIDIARGIGAFIDRKPGRIYVSIGTDDLFRAAGIAPGLAAKHGYRLSTKVSNHALIGVAKDILARSGCRELDEVWKVETNLRPFVATALAMTNLLPMPTVWKGRITLPRSISLTWSEPPKNQCFAGIEGEVYFQAEPGAPAFVAVGDEIKVDQIIFVVVANKVNNQIPATRPMRIKRILVGDGTKVEAETPVFEVEYLDEGA